MPLAITATTGLLIGIAATAFVGVFGPYLAYFGSKRQRAHERELAADQHEHERQLAADARLFERRAGAYVELLRHVHNDSLRVARTHPIISFGEPEVPDPLPQDERLSMFGRIAAFGSQGVLEEAETFARTVNEFFINASTLDRVRDTESETRELRETLEELRGKAREAIEGLEKRIREELERPQPISSRAARGSIES